MAPSKQPIETPFPQKLLHFKQRTLPLLIWSVAVLVVGALLIGRAQRLEYIGLAQAHEFEISSPSPGTLQTVVVDLYDEVEAGEVVARLDDSQVVAAIETANARIGQLTAQFEAARVELMVESGRGVADWTADLRRFQIDEESRRLDALELKVTIESDQVELERLALEVRRMRPQMDAGLISDSELDNVELIHDQVLKQIEENQVLLAQTETEFLKARQRRIDYEEQLPKLPHEDSVLEPLQKAIEVETRLLNEIETQRSALVLRSPVHGQVSQVLCRKGQSVIRGEPILMIADRSVQEIVAYLSESETRGIERNTEVVLSSRNRQGPLAESLVLRVGPTVETLPQRLWPDPRIPAYGRAVVIAATPAMQLVPGETINVEFRDRKE